jgi:hypothetical protein
MIFVKYLAYLHNQHVEIIQAQSDFFGFERG